MTGDHLADPTLESQFLSASSDPQVAMYDAFCKWMLLGNSEICQIVAFDIGEETEVVFEHAVVDHGAEFDVEVPYFMKQDENEEDAK
ncbi:hypothetical protein HK405_014057 [Cladochytrium tenue]|nr:hypothetical protein HK405_014057 [Cladochytrium tenue]